VYVNENGNANVLTGATEPSPFSVIVTLVALPPKVLPLTLIASEMQVVPLLLLRVTVGLFVQTR
jgi:hypothetical protein